MRTISRATRQENGHKTSKRRELCQKYNMRTISRATRQENVHKSIKSYIKNCMRITSHVARQENSVTGQNIPGQNIPGQNIPGQNIPGQNIPDKIYPDNTYRTKYTGHNGTRTKHTGQKIPGQNILDNMYRTKYTEPNIPDKIYLITFRPMTC